MLVTGVVILVLYAVVFGLLAPNVPLGFHWAFSTVLVALAYYLLQERAYNIHLASGGHRRPAGDVLFICAAVWGFLGVVFYLAAGASRSLE